MTLLAYFIHTAVCDAEVPWSHRLKYFQNSFAADKTKGSRSGQPQRRRSVPTGTPQIRVEYGWSYFLNRKPAIRLQRNKIQSCYTDTRVVRTSLSDKKSTVLSIRTKINDLGWPLLIWFTVDRMNRCRLWVMTTWTLSKYQFGQSSVVNSHTTYTDLIILFFAGYRNVEREK